MLIQEAHWSDRIASISTRIKVNLLNCIVICLRGKLLASTYIRNSNVYVNYMGGEFPGASTRINLVRISAMNRVCNRTIEKQRDLKQNVFIQQKIGWISVFYSRDSRLIPTCYTTNFIWSQANSFGFEIKVSVWLFSQFRTHHCWKWLGYIYIQSYLGRRFETALERNCFDFFLVTIFLF